MSRPKLPADECEMMVRLPRELHARLKAYAKQSDLNMSQMIRKLIRTELDAVGFWDLPTGPKP